MAPREMAIDEQCPPTFKVSDEPQRLRFKDLLVDLDAYRVSRAGRMIELGPTEYRLLCFFLRHPSKVFTRENLIESVWPADASIDVRTVDVHIGRLRRSLRRHGQADLIRTVRSVGYALG
mgnify:CR=1 FL=1